jgi:hypothetical protein
VTSTDLDTKTETRTAARPSWVRSGLEPISWTPESPEFFGRSWHIGLSKTVVRRERRAFSAEFEAEAVRVVAARRADGAALTQIGRELEVRPDQLRAWVRMQCNVEFFRDAVEIALRLGGDIRMRPRDCPTALAV